VTQQKPMDVRVAQFQEYYRRENKRPLLGFFVGSEYPIPRYPASQSLPEDRLLAPDDFPASPYMDDFEALFESHEACGGDFIWSGAAYWGIPWVEALLGCGIRANHGSGALTADHPASFGGPDSIPAFDPDDPWAQKTLEFLQAAAERSNGRWPLATTRMRGIADLLATLYGDENLLMAMMSEPEQVHAAAERLTDLWIAYARFQLENIPDFHGGLGSFYYYMWAPEGTVWHQEDAAALLSPALYEEFIRPRDQRIINALPHVVMHSHPTGYVPVDSYTEMDFLALEHHIDEGGPSAEDLYDRHLKMLESGPLIIWGYLKPRDLDWLFKKLPVEGLAILAAVRDPQEAENVWREYGG
jgi:hypothetical protein